MPFEFQKLSIPDVVLIKPMVFPDGRGFFAETYKCSEFVRAGIRERFVQDNRSRSSKNVLRGLHYQKKPSAQGKLIRCLHGKILDVAVDIRPESNTFGKWVSSELSDENHLMMYVPEGFAHGLLVLSDFADIEYKCTNEYSPACECGIIWNDPDINIQWNIETPLLSAKDSQLPRLRA